MNFDTIFIGDGNMEICTNPDILRIIYFIKILINIIMIFVPIGLIIFGLIDVSKSTISSDDGEQKKNFKLLFKRIVYAVVIFAIIWIVKVFMGLLGDLSNGVNFTSCWTNANADKIEQLQKVKDSKEQKKNTSSNDDDKNEMNNSYSGSNASSSNNNTANKSSESNVILVGDSRFRGMCDSVKLDSNTDCIAEVGKGYNWLISSSVVSQLDELIKTNPSSYVVINLGVNDLGNVNSYAKYYNKLINSYSKIKLVVISVNPIEDDKASSYGYSVKNENVTSFNSTIKSLINSNISYCDTYSKIKNNFETTDGIHYTTNTYNNIYNEIKKCLK